MFVLSFDEMTKFDFCDMCFSRSETIKNKNKKKKTYFWRKLEGKLFWRAICTQMCSGFKPNCSDQNSEDIMTHPVVWESRDADLHLLFWRIRYFWYLLKIHLLHILCETLSRWIESDHKVWLLKMLREQTYELYESGMHTPPQLDLSECLVMAAVHPMSSQYSLKSEAIGKIQWGEKKEKRI